MTQQTDRAALLKEIEEYYKEWKGTSFPLLQRAAAMLEEDGKQKCSDHPDAPHGFNRNASHTLECEGWSPEPPKPIAYLAWRDGKPCYEGDDAVCEDAVWPVDFDDDRTSMPVYLAPQPQRPRLSEREIELLDGMIEVQLNHAERCDAIPNRKMAEKQKGWDMERVALLRKVRGEA